MVFISLLSDFINAKNQISSQNGSIRFFAGFGADYQQLCNYRRGKNHKQNYYEMPQLNDTNSSQQTLGLLGQGPQVRVELAWESLAAHFG